MELGPALVASGREPVGAAPRFSADPDVQATRNTLRVCLKRL
jgi:hypothetical protein